MVQTVVVIGAGVSGLTAIKACLEEGLDPVCFERSDDIGGLWRFTDEVEDGRASIYSSLVTNSSKEAMAFSDFPMPEDFPNFLPSYKYLEYLKLYAEKFNLLKYIQFKTVVCQVKKHSDFPVTGQWMVDTENNGEIKTSVFDAVLVCSGQYVCPNIPPNGFPGIDNFKGKVFHSRQYKKPHGHDGKRILVVGMGNSGVDIATELCTKASQVYLTTRRGVWVIPRLGKKGYPFDLFLVRRISSWLDKILPAAVRRWLMKQYFNSQFDHELYNIQPEGIAWKEPLVNEELPSRILSGLIIIKPGVTRFTETAAHFSNGSIVDNLDVVILATGYNYNFPFLEESNLKKDANNGYLYKKIIPLHIEKPTIAFISFIQPIGSLMVTAELQCRWVTRLFKENNCRRTNYIAYLDDLASDIGVKPNIFKLYLTDPVLAYHLVFGACNSYHFRLTGPGKWSGARDAILMQWDRIEKPLRTRVPKKDSKLLLPSHVLFIFCGIILMVAVWLMG